MPRRATCAAAARSAASSRACVLALAVLVLGTVALAQVADAPDQTCEAELARVQRAVSGQPNGLVAARLLRSAVEYVEPALPPAPGADVREDVAESPDAAWLDARRLLPDGWTPSSVDPTAWRETLDAWRARYDLGPAETEGATAPRALSLDLARTLEDLRRTVRPLGLIALENDRVVFNAVIWNFTPYPRLLLGRPADAPGIDSALTGLSTCALVVDHYITAPADAALALFVSGPETELRVLASRPDGDGRWPIRVANSDAAELFRYTSPLVADYDLVSVAFEGPSMSVGSVLGILPRMGGNVGLTRLPYFLSFP